MSGLYNQQKFKVAAIQAGPIFRDAPQYFDVDATLDKGIGLIDEAGRKGARLIVFPECWLPCYPYWSHDLTEQATFVDIWAKFLWSSVEVPGRETEALCTAAKRANAYVVMGINERDRKFQGRMYNSILYLSPRGEIMGTHRKICITAHERLFQTPGDGGDNLRTVFKTEIGNLGGSICGEHQQFTLLYNWIMQGIQIHCSLWPGCEWGKNEMPGDIKVDLTGKGTVPDILTRAICITAGAFGVRAATYIPEKDQPKNFYRNSLFSIPQAFCGGSGVIHPDKGEYVTGPVWDKEAIVYGDINLSDTDKSLWATGLAGIYSRWDLINLHVRQERYEPIAPMEAPEQVLPASESNQVEDLAARVKQLEQYIVTLLPETLKNTSDKA
jgi:predicted amidohydrolase